MKFIKKEYGYIFLILLIAIGSGVIFFYPQGLEQLINYKYPYSYENLVDKKANIESRNSSLKQNEGQIRSSIQALEEIKSLEKDKSNEAFEVRKTIKESDFEFKISSILISLEQRAYENNVDLKIAYSSIKHIANNGDVNDYNYEENQEVEQPEEGEDNKEEIEVKEKNDSDKDKEIEEVIDEDTFKPSQEMIDKGTVQIDGIDIAVIPISIEGSYHNVRNYIKYLDKIGMIEPSTVVMTSEGKTVKGQIILNVFHGEVGL